MNVFMGDYPRTDDEWEELVWVRQRTDVPKGCRVEVLEGLITVTHYSANAHHAIASCVQRSLHDVIPGNWGVHQRLAMVDPSRLGLYVPDLAVVPEEPPCGGDGSFVLAAAAELVVEITSRATADNDRGKKAAGYAWAGVPFYLLIDSLAPGGPTITLYGEPEEGIYRVLRAGRFGDAFLLPEPFDVDLGISGFPIR